MPTPKLIWIGWNRLWRERVDHYRNIEQLLAQVRDFLRAMPDGTLLEPVPPSPVSIDDNDPRARVETLRRRVEDTRLALRNVINARAPLDDAKRQVREYVDAMAGRGGPGIVGTDRGELRIPLWSADTIQGPVKLPQLISVIAFFFRDHVIETLDAYVEALPVSADSLPPDQREEKIRELEGVIIEAEREEEAIIEAAAAMGITVARRIDASPFAVLSLRVAAAAQARQAA